MSVSSAGPVRYEALVQHDRIHASLYTDPRIFADELEQIFYRGWVFVGHESEIRRPGDFITRHIGTQPVIMARGSNAEVSVLLNRCAHRGTLVCAAASGHTRYVGSHACEIVGMPTGEARALLREQLEAATRPELVYTHRWNPGDLVMWDNRAAPRRPWDENRYRRVMHRTTVAGDGPTVPDAPSLAVAPARETDIAWGRAQLAAV